MGTRLRQHALIWLLAAGLCLTIPGCFRTVAIAVGSQGAEFSKPTLQAKLVPQSVPEDQNVPPDMPSTARHFMLAANDDVSIDIQRFDFSITDHTNPQAPPAQCTPYASQNNRGGGQWACDGAFRNTSLGNILYKIRVYQCPNGTACPDDPQANAPNLVLETDAVQFTGNPVTAVPTQPHFQPKEDADYQIKAVLVITANVGSTVPVSSIEGPPLDSATLSVVTPGMTRTFPSAIGTMLVGREFAPLTYSGQDPAGNNEFTFVESPTLGDFYTNFSDNLAITSVQVLDESGTPIPFCSLRIARRNRCPTQPPDFTTADLSSCAELARNGITSLTPAHPTPASSNEPLEWIAQFVSPRGLPDINCHPNVPAPGTKLSLSFQLKVK